MHRNQTRETNSMETIPKKEKKTLSLPTRPKLSPEKMSIKTRPNFEMREPTFTHTTHFHDYCNIRIPQQLLLLSTFPQTFSMETHTI